MEQLLDNEKREVLIALDSSRGALQLGWPALLVAIDEASSSTPAVSWTLPPGLLVNFCGCLRHGT